MEPDLGKRVMNVATLAMLVWRLLAPTYGHGTGQEARLEDALLQLSGGSFSHAGGAALAPDYEPYLACATAADAQAMQLQCAPFTNRS